ncbi:uncharacterized protein LOC120282128 [Dioscorea cayenensis subsp. rotundata]|uniref:Uncharacterized protein LOC120282128 n=1 Tax=Dioscorea cayennensis subsp. rotundata TaxID=55577 RepID=A0AB40CZH0_DIOCR|nr:uncharacterized protein LOC120282128 [Dioscorea cayenensis subsp. rotundata]
MASSSTTEVPLPTLPLFKGEGYERWCVKMKTLFRSQGLWKVVENGVITTGTEAQKEDSQKEDAKAMYLIQQAVDDHIFDRISAAKSAKEAWEQIQKQHQGPSRIISVRRQTLRQRFEVLQMKDTENIQEYITRVVTIVNQIKGLGFEITEEEVVSKILRSLTPRFNYVVAAIEEAKDISKMSLDELTSSLQAHEIRMENVGEKVEERAFHVKGESSGVQKWIPRGRGRGVFHGRGRGRGRGRVYVPKQNSGGDYTSQANNQRPTRSYIQCHICKRYGHLKADCRFRNKAADTNFLETNISNEPTNLFMVQTTGQHPGSSIWLVDSVVPTI